MKRVQCGICAGVVPAVLAATPAIADYEPGFVWNRLSDFTPGAEHGTSINNPGPDQMGNAAWGYAYATGDGFAGETPWYQNPGTVMTWDEDWFGHGFGVWSRGDDQSPLMTDAVVTHHNKAGSGQYVPVVSWLNPVGDATVVDLAGSLTLTWNAGNGNAFPNDVEFVVAHNDISAGTITPLFSDTYVKPTPGISETESLDFDVAVEGIMLDQGDSLVISHRASDDFPYGWVNLTDSYDITLVPTPAVASLLGLAGIGLTRRRR